MKLKDVKTVMVVDDNDTDILIARIVIEKAGFKGKIITKNSGKGALEYIDAEKNNPENLPELIFLDINMPVVNGFVFLFEYERFPEEMKKNCKIAVLTSSDNKSDMERFLVHDFVIDFILKPLTVNSFDKLVDINS